MRNLPVNFQSCQASWKYQWSSTTCCAYPWNWSVLLEQDGQPSDYFSKFPLVRKISNTSTHSVIKELGMIFTEFGCPFVLKSDNGLCYTSREFLEFCQVHQIMSSPYHPQSNGFAETLVGILKKLMEKSIKDGKMWNYGLLQYRVTPIAGNFPSPLEALTGRRPRTSLPQIPSSVRKSVETSRIRNELIKHQPNTSTHPFSNGTCFCEGSAWKCMENWYNWSTSQGTWIILGEISWQFHTEKDQINDQTLIATFLFWVGSWRQRMEQKRTHSTMFSPSLQLKSPSTGDLSFASGQYGSTSFDKQCYTVCSRTHSCQFHWCDSTFHHKQWSSGNSIHSKMIQPTKGIPPVRFTPLKKWLRVPYGTLWRPMERLFHVHSVLCRIHLVYIEYTHGLVNQSDN